MFRTSKAKTTETTAQPKSGKGCCLSRICGAAKPQPREAIMGVLTFLSMFGPRRLRQHLQHLLAVFAIAAFVVRAIKPKREDKIAR